MEKIINKEMLAEEGVFLKNKSLKISFIIAFLAIVSFFSIKFGYIEFLALTIPFFLLCLAEYLLTKHRLNRIELILFSTVGDEYSKI